MVVMARWWLVGYDLCGGVPRSGGHPVRARGRGQRRERKKNAADEAMMWGGWSAGRVGSLTTGVQAGGE